MFIRILIISIFVNSIVLGQFISPKIKFREEFYDFGSINRGDIVEHFFEFFNIGDDTLKIAYISATCGCSAGLLNKREFQPGEKGNLIVRFNSTGKYGIQTNKIFVHTNDPDNPIKVLTIRAEVISKIDTLNAAKIVLDRITHDFGNIEEGKIHETLFVIKNMGRDTLEIQEIITSCGCTAAVPRKRRIAPNEQTEFKVQLDTTNRFGSLKNEIIVRTNDPIQPETHLYLIAVVNKN